MYIMSFPQGSCVEGLVLSWGSQSIKKQLDYKGINFINERMNPLISSVDGFRRWGLDGAVDQ